MFKELRLSKYKMDEKSSHELLSNAEYGVLSTIGEDEYCYGIPVNYVFINNAIYFHCGTKESHKLDNINNHSKVSFTIVGNTKVLPNKLDTRYESIIVFGQAALLNTENNSEKIEALQAIVEKYAPNFIKNGNLCIEKNLERTNIVKISIDYISGKSSYLEGDIVK